MRWYDRPAHGRTRCEDSVVAGEIDTCSRYESSQPGDEVFRAEKDVCCAVAEGFFSS